MTSASMFSRRGPMPSTATTVSSSTTATVALGSAASGRRMLLAAAPSADALALKLASAVPGVPPSNIAVAVSSYAFGGYIIVADAAGFLTTSTWTTSVQNAFLNGLDGDLVPDVNHITVQSVQPLLISQQCNTASAKSSLPACPLTGAFANSYIDVPGLSELANGVVVEFTVSGYDTYKAAQADLLSLLDASGSGFAATAARLSAAESQLASSYVTAGVVSGDPQNAAYFSQSFSSVGPASVLINMLDGGSAPMYAPQVYAVYSVSVVTNPSSSGAVLNALNSALTSGTDPSGTLSSFPPSRNYALAEGVDTCGPKWSKAWYGVGIAFVIAFGLQTLALGVFAHKLMSKAAPAASSDHAMASSDKRVNALAAKAAATVESA